jgi:hypothetical protein
MELTTRLGMSDPLLRELDHYVVLEPACGERLLTAAETEQWLAERLGRLAEPPHDLAHLPTAVERAQRLLATACELELEPGVAIQWYAVRLEPPSG